MFKKPLAHQSNATPLRSSARRQLLSSISAQYPGLVPSEGDEDGQSPTTMTAKEVGKLVLPEGVRTTTFETSAGIEGTFWQSAEGDPLWMTSGRAVFGQTKEYIPTLYLLGQPLPHPPLPIIELHSPIPPPILTGAPLFIAAVKYLRKPWLLPDVPKDSLVAFTSAVTGTSGEVIYVGVGRVAAEGGVRGAVERRQKVLDEGVDKDEGKFCDILCIIGDHLWESGSKTKLESFPPPLPIKALAPDPNIRTTPKAGPSRPSSPTTSEPAITSSMDQLDLSTPRKDATPARDIEPLTPSEISTLLGLALIQALSEIEPSALPMPASLLYSAHVLPNRPAYIPKAQREDVVIGKSEWKKLTKWMKEASKDGLIKIKESKGEVTVTGIDAKHPPIQNHGPHGTIAEEERKAAKKAAREATVAEPSDRKNGPAAASSAVSKGKGKEIHIEELWKPSSTSIPFWEACGLDKTKLNPPGLIKSALDDYVAKHKLFDRSEPRYLTLDEELGRACGVKRPEPGQRMSRDEIMKKLRGGVVWQVSIGGVIKKGTLQPVTMSVKIRQGRKTVTIITGLETFSIPPDEFAEELKKLCAGSTTVQPLQGASPKLNLSEVMVQGSQIKVVTESLLARGVPKKWIKEGDKK